MNTPQETFKQILNSDVKRNNVFSQGSPVGQKVDVNKLETLICLELLLVTCYQTLGWLIHNRTIRLQCQQFEQHASYHQEELKKIFPLSRQSELTIENKVNQYILQIKPANLSLREIINLIINFTSFKIDLYKHFSRTSVEHQVILNSFLQDNVEEMFFLDQERKFHQNRVSAYLSDESLEGKGGVFK